MVRELEYGFAVSGRRCELKFALFIGYHLYMLCGLDVSFLFPFHHNITFNWPSHLSCHLIRHWQQVPHPIAGPPAVRHLLAIRGLTG